MRARTLRYYTNATHNVRVHYFHSALPLSIGRSDERTKRRTNERSDERSDEVTDEATNERTNERTNENSERTKTANDGVLFSVRSAVQYQVTYFNRHQ